MNNQNSKNSEEIVANPINIEQDYVQCPNCLEPIKENAKKCYHCQSILTFGSKAVRILKVVGIIASLFVVYFMFKANQQNKKAIQIQANGLDAQRVYLDSTLKIMSRDIELTRESNRLNNDLLLFSFKVADEENQRFKEQYRPILDLYNYELLIDSSGSSLFLTLKNQGKGTAAEVICKVDCKNWVTGISFSIRDYNISYLLSNEKKVLILTNPFPDADSLAFKIDVEWVWEKFDEQDNFREFIIFRKDSLNIYQARVFLEKEYENK